jgi:alkanesulfonate monooxygenase SsuD/methylene tetrahydromethanopterin reductase-like flavin-dependent oxidoreductase (luciferase family)
VRFTYAEAMTDATYYAPLAQAAEKAGYTSMTVADSLIYPKESDSQYPYTDTGDREFLQGKEFIETMILCAHLFAVTSTLRLTPFVLKLPVRPPVLVAKQASSLAFLSNNRLGLGVGISPWPEDFAALGVPWEKRGKRMDECMDILRGLTSGEFFGYQGGFRCSSAAMPTSPCVAPFSRAMAGCTPAATVKSWTACWRDWPRSARKKATPATISRSTSSPMTPTRPTV